MALCLQKVLNKCKSKEVQISQILSLADRTENTFSCFVCSSHQYWNQHTNSDPDLSLFSYVQKKQVPCTAKFLHCCPQEMTEQTLKKTKKTKNVVQK